MPNRDPENQVTTPRHLRHTFLHCVWSGLALLNLALFLHPMDPIDFLSLALSEPLQTVSDAYGIQAAVLFWLSAALTFLGLAGLIFAGKLHSGPGPLRFSPAQNPPNANA